MKKDIKVLCVFCAKLVSATIEAQAEIVADCETCGTEIELGLTVKCDICGKDLYKVEESSYSGIKISNKLDKKEYL